MENDESLWSSGYITVVVKSSPLIARIKGEVLYLYKYTLKPWFSPN